MHRKFRIGSNSYIVYLPIVIPFIILAYWASGYFIDGQVDFFSWTVILTLLAGICLIGLYKYKDGYITLNMFFIIPTKKFQCNSISNIVYLDNGNPYGALLKFQFNDGAKYNLFISRNGRKCLFDFFELHCGVKVKIKVVD